ncbi:hypothetical protein VLQ41_001115 [Salmonella enterica]|nr:hypothetical protein [Salmonella enterica]ECO7560525.1 hypothetical protein [Salmonella enterica]EMC8574270.1 hypothetical protein [Salmonella enterica]EME8510554.1 hypothetical protein [Salmonella enterica]
MECSVSDLVKRGHEQAAELKSSCGAIDVRSVEQLISDLASHLDVQLARSNALATENAGLKKFCKDAAFDADYEAELGMERGGFSDALNEIKTPDTDAFLAEIRAEARNEGINYTASRLAAAFNHGFINKSLREVFDVTRMILSAKEELANEPHPIDGLSGEYAEKSLEEWAEQIRKGVQS